MVLHLHVGLATVATVKEGADRRVDGRDMLCLIPAVVGPEDLSRLLPHFAEDVLCLIVLEADRVIAGGDDYGRSELTPPRRLPVAFSDQDLLGNRVVAHEHLFDLVWRRLDVTVLESYVQWESH